MLSVIRVSKLIILYHLLEAGDARRSRWLTYAGVGIHWLYSNMKLVGPICPASTADWSNAFLKHIYQSMQ